MGDYSELRSAISNAIKANGNGEITGEVLQSTLLSIVNTLGAYPNFGGMVTADTNPTGRDQNVFYIAYVPGTYPNFGGLTVKINEICVFTKTAKGWVNHVVTQYSTTKAGALASAPSAYDTIFSKEQVFPYFNFLEGASSGAPDYDIFIPAGSTGRTTFAVKSLANLLSWEYAKGTCAILEIEYTPETSMIFESVLRFQQSVSPYAIIGKSAFYEIAPGRGVLVAFFDKANDSNVRIAFQLSDNRAMLVDTYIRLKSIRFRPFTSSCLGSYIDNFKVGEIEALRSSVCNSIRDLAFASPVNGAVALGQHTLSIPALKGQGAAFTCSFATIESPSERAFCLWRVRITGGVDPSQVKMLFQINSNPYTTFFETNTIFLKDSSGCYYYGGNLTFTQHSIDQCRTALQLKAAPEVEGTIEVVDVFIMPNDSALSEELLIKNLHKAIPPLAWTRQGETFSIGDSSVSLNINFEGTPSLQIVATIKDSQAPTDLLLKTLRIKTFNAIPMTIYVGQLDQRSWCIPRTKFVVEPKDKGLNVFDLQLRGIIVKEGEQLFVAIHENELVETIGFSRNSEARPNEMLYGRLTGPLARLATEFGGTLCMDYEGVEVESIFALKSEIPTVSTTISNDSDNFPSVVSDQKGGFYTIKVVNGQLLLKSMSYKKPLVLSNSYGRHGRVYSYGWCALRGMAASVDSNDFVSLLREGLGVPVAVDNIAEWEREFSPTFIPESLQQDTDCVIISLGQNVIDVEAFYTGLKQLIMNCLNTAPQADIYLTTELFSVVEKDNVIRKVAHEYGLPLIDCASLDTVNDKQKTGAYTIGDKTTDSGSSWDTSVQVEYPILYSGVAGHPSDNGMLHIANCILKTLRRPTLDIQYEVKVVNQSNATYSSHTKWVARGLCTVLPSAAVTAIVKNDLTGEVITHTVHSDNAITFIMPYSNVTVTLT